MIRSSRPARPGRYRLGLLPACLALTACGADARAPAGPPAPPASSVVAGFTIPAFATADEQLTYAKSLSADPRQKVAALNLIFGRFPEDRHRQGKARFVRRAMQLAGNNVSRAARLLGLTRPTLHYRLEKFASVGSE